MKIAASAASYEEAVAMTDGRKSVINRHWPTPTAKGNQAAPSMAKNGTASRRMVDAASSAKTPDPNSLAGETSASEASGASTRRMTLNPEWIEWLQGFPPGWLDV